eukprot:14080980-Ditylum_brightwellii.AAC.1
MTKVKTLSLIITTIALIKKDSEIAAASTPLTPLKVPSGSSSNGNFAADATDMIQIFKLWASKRD